MKTIVVVKRICVYIERAVPVDFRPDKRSSLGVDVDLLRHYFRVTGELPAMYSSLGWSIHLQV